MENLEDTTRSAPSKLFALVSREVSILPLKNCKYESAAMAKLKLTIKIKLKDFERANAL
jgi:hypothetical protein